ncbi:hypothetical protein D3C87_1920900 [compost metagenome]
MSSRVKGVWSSALKKTIPPIRRSSLTRGTPIRLVASWLLPTASEGRWWWKISL